MCRNGSTGRRRSNPVDVGGVGGAVAEARTEQLAEADEGCVLIEATGATTGAVVVVVVVGYECSRLVAVEDVVGGGYAGAVSGLCRASELEEDVFVLDYRHDPQLSLDVPS
ncbi:hypothetical protein NM208_g16648 [Fusarium decemcellulare]|uniref:Uncharacterized protein n=1 Tax=Fusarium decemcellulare TaxID=57161 RepID=A0ACC1R9Q3_9HYPO|nr:hypothetical protein NM208_g16648 [Fusarium decemcellulare]